MAFRWWADDGPTLNAGLVALRFSKGSRPVLLRNPIALWFSRGVGRVQTPCPPSWSVHYLPSCSWKIRFDITCESSSGTWTTCNIKSYLVSENSLLQIFGDTLRVVSYYDKEVTTWMLRKLLILSTSYNSTIFVGHFMIKPVFGVY